MGREAGVPDDPPHAPLDKTGTLTAGSPRLREVKSFGRLRPAELLRLAASLDQASPHPLAAAITAAARQRGLALSFPTQVEEQHGIGALSYAGQFNITAVADRETCPDAAVFAQGARSSLDALAQSVLVRSA